MGNKLSDQQQFDRKFKETYLKVKDVLDKQFGHMTVYRQRKNPERNIYVKSTYLSTSYDHTRNNQLTEKRTSMVFSNLIELFGCQVTTQMENLCSETHKIMFYLDYFENNFDEDVEKRQAKQEFYPEPTIWNIFLTVVESELCLLYSGMCIGDLRPYCIKLDNQGEVKISDCNLIPPMQTALVRYIQSKDHTYLAPETIELALRRDTAHLYNIEKADMYALGMCLLEICTLNRGGLFYDHWIPEIKTNLIQDALVQVGQKYSHFLQKMIEICLSPNPQDRPSSKQLFNIVRPFYYLIKNRQPFEANKQLIYTTLSYPEEHLPNTPLLEAKIEEMKKTEILNQEAQRKVVESTLAAAEIKGSQQMVPPQIVQAVTQPQTFGSQQLSQKIISQPQVIPQPQYIRTSQYQQPPMTTNIPSTILTKSQRVPTDQQAGAPLQPVFVQPQPSQSISAQRTQPVSQPGFKSLIASNFNPSQSQQRYLNNIRNFFKRTEQKQPAINEKQLGEIDTKVKEAIRSSEALIKKSQHKFAQQRY